MNYNEKQIQIINTAEKLFAAKGFDGTSVRDIAEEAGVNLAMISYYFGSKEKLMEAVFGQRTQHMAWKIESLLKDDKTEPLQKMFILVDDYIERVLTTQQFFKLMVYEQMMEKNPIVTNLLNELKKKNGELIERLITDGQEKKVFRKNIDVIFLMNTLVGTVMQTFINKEYYKFYNNLQALTKEEYVALLKNKLTNHLKNIFKAILSYEG